MSQYVRTNNGNFYDLFQQQSMDDFYAILQDYMDPELEAVLQPQSAAAGSRPALHRGDTQGKDGEDPEGLVPAAVDRLHRRQPVEVEHRPGLAPAERQTRQRVAVQPDRHQPGHAAPGPAAVREAVPAEARRPRLVPPGPRDNAAKYEPAIRSKADAWLKEMETNSTGTPEELAKLRKQITDLRDAAIANKQYWAFAIYTYATTPAYLNMLQTIIASGDEIDGSQSWPAGAAHQRPAERARHVELLHVAVRLRAAAVPRWPRCCRS